MNLPMASLGAAVGALLGAIAWFVVGYVSDYEVGYIAIGVGFLAGKGASIFRGPFQSPILGFICVAVSLVAIAGSKYALLEVSLSKVLSENYGENYMTFSEEDMMVVIADTVVYEMMAEGKTLQWPAGMSVEYATNEADYPTEVWKAATERINQMSGAEKDAMMAAQQEMVAQNLSMIRKEAFASLFGLYDLLWFGLAGFCAFRYGSGNRQ